MNAAVHILEDLSVAEVEAVPQQRQLASEIARARTRRASLEHELRDVEGELQELAPQRERHQLVVEACASLEKLAAVGGASLFWGAETSSDRASEQLQAARGRVAQLGEWFSHMEGRQATLRQQIVHFNDTIDALERSLFEVQYEEEQLSYEWEIEREIDEKPRKALLSWVYSGEEDKRFRKSAALALLLTLLFSAIVSQMNLPPLIAADGEPVPQRVVRLLMEERPAAACAGRNAEAEGARAGREEAGREAGAGREGRAEGRGAGTEGTRSEGSGHSRVPREACPGQRRSGRRPTRLAGAHRQLRLRRSRAALDADHQRGGFERRHQSGVDQPWCGRRPRQRRRHGRRENDAREQLDRGSRHAWRRSSGEPAMSAYPVAPTKKSRSCSTATSRRSIGSTTRSCASDPTLKGQVILQLTIEPDGTVSLCELKASDMNAPDLTAQVVERVKGFDFGAKAVPAITILYPIDFLPAA